MSALWVVGDVHGACDKLRVLLHSAGLIDQEGQWAGADAHLAFLGDYLDRGPDGIGVIRLVRTLEEQAPRAGGQLTALIGNHEVMLLAAQKFQQVDPHDRLGFYEYWAGNGGQLSDLESLTPDELFWLGRRPALARSGKWLLAHADSLFYLQLGHAVQTVNKRTEDLLKSTDPAVWASFASAFVDRLNYVTADGEIRAFRMLEQYGGERLVHGHSPVHLLLNENEQGLAGDTDHPVEYAGGRCVGVDSGMAYFAEAGFIVRLGDSAVEEVVHLPE